MKSVKSLNRMSWATGYWLKALKWQIWVTNAKPFFWENDVNVETLQNFSPFEFPINLIWSLSIASMESYELPNFSSRVWNVKVGWRIQNYFSGKVRQTLKVSENLLPILESPINLFWSVSKAWIASYELRNIGSRF